jgi:hypothetical protein
VDLITGTGSTPGVKPRSSNACSTTSVRKSTSLPSVDRLRPRRSDLEHPRPLPSGSSARLRDDRWLNLNRPVFRACGGRRGGTGHIRVGRLDHLHHGQRGAGTEGPSQPPGPKPHAGLIGQR